MNARNEVAAVTRRLIEVLTSGTIVPDVAKAFESKPAGAFFLIGVRPVAMRRF
jgi:hypothetical protein